MQNRPHEKERQSQWKPHFEPDRAPIGGHERHEGAPHAPLFSVRATKSRRL